MSQAHFEAPADTRRWVQYHVIAFCAVLGVAAGLIIVDAKIGKTIGDEAMPNFRAILFLSVLLAGVGARALLAWRSATVDRQGRVFLAAIGLVLLTGAAFGLSNCLQEIRERVRASDSRETQIQRTWPLENWP